MEDEPERDVEEEEDDANAPSDPTQVCPSCNTELSIFYFLRAGRSQLAKRCGSCRVKLMAARRLGPREQLALEDLVAGRSPWARYYSSADAPRNLNGLVLRGLVTDNHIPTEAGIALVRQWKRDPRSRFAPAKPARKRGSDRKRRSGGQS